MAEKRKVEFSMLLKIKGKTHKIEFFNAKLWGYERGNRETLDRYRMRVNGKWYKRYEKEQFSFLSKWEARDLIWRGI